MEFSLYLSSRSIICDMEFINLAHCVYTCDYHIVLVTRYRRKVFNEGIFAHFEERVGRNYRTLPVNKDKDSKS